MPNVLGSETAVKDAVAPDYLNADELCDDMSESEIKNANELEDQKIEGRIAVQRRGFRAYLKELPQLLDQHQEGRMVAYLDNERIGIADTDARLQTNISSNPRYAKKLDEIFVTRIIESDVEDHAISR